VELHDALALPRARRGRSRVAVDENHVVAAAGQCDGGEETRRSGANDDRSHHLLDESRAQRLAGARTVVKRLTALDALTDAVSRTDAVDLAWLATDPVLFDRFVRIRGWSVGKFETWLARTLTSQLLKP
jgi:hypothetical protein